ncbi:MAG: hypothetical protein I8H66_00835 [Sphingobacteriia bacterium]|nr:hypothetical protein [Sphingobacteriia bacterium]
MMYNKAFLLMTFLLLMETTTSGQFNNNFKDKIKSINSLIAKAYLDKNVETIISYYNIGATCMPEYHKALYNKSDISKYFQQWFVATKSNIYSRTIYDVENIKGYLIEVGTFQNDFVKADNDSFVYKGKYIRFWKIEKNKTLTILSDIWGAVDYLDRSRFPLIENTETDVMPNYSVTRKVKKEVEKRNQTIAELVIKRQGEQHSTFFSQDAIYMPYYKPMLIGIDSVKSYFVEHEKVGDVNIDSLQIKASKIIDLGNIVFEQGYYGVKWRTMDSKNEGVVKGKSINIWKRNEKGVLMLYRQMVNHD